MNGYIFFFDGKRVEIYADSLYEAKQKALDHFKPAKSKQHMVHGMIAECNGVPIVHTTAN